MGDSLPDSSDSVRHAKPLRYVQTATLAVPLALELGGQLPSVTVAYETYGQLSPARDNAVLICHAISGDSHVAKHTEEDDPGWWDIVVGPGKAIDTNRYFVVCPNMLGSCRGTLGPGGLNPETGRPYGKDFPTITVGDMVEVQRRLLDHLEVKQLHAVVGGSIGGHQSLTWATRFPERVRHVIALATSPRLTSQALAFDVVGRNAIRSDPDYHGGQYYEEEHGPEVGLAIARMIGHITYLSEKSMHQKFGRKLQDKAAYGYDFRADFQVESYLRYKGDHFVNRFDANSYLYISKAMDYFDLAHPHGNLAEAFANVKAKFLVISFSSDWLFPSYQSKEIVSACRRVGAQAIYTEIQTDYGHDAFLLESEQISSLVTNFLTHGRKGAS
jgi:homoserine O-acetyltransferase/O-succinyltransferase